MHDLVYQGDSLKADTDPKRPTEQTDLFHMIYQKYKSQVYRAVVNYTGGSDLAYDLYQDIFVKVFNNISRKTSYENEKAWIARVTHHVIIDHWRWKKRWQKIFLESE